MLFCATPRVLLIFAARGRAAAIQKLERSFPAFGMHSAASAAARRAAVPASVAAAAPQLPSRSLLGGRPWWWSCARQRSDGFLAARAAPSSSSADSGGQPAAGGESDPAATAPAAPARGRPRRRASAAPAAATASASEDPPAPAPVRRRTTRRATAAAPAASAPPSEPAAPPKPAAAASAKKPRAPRATTTTTTTRARRPTTFSSSSPNDSPNPNSDTNSDPRLYIIDLLAQAHRMAHGLAPAALSTADGSTRTGVAHGLAQLVLSLLRRRTKAPTHMAVVVDAPGATWRHERYPQYKAQRLPSPPGFREEVGRALELLSALGLPVLAVPGVEADDVVASLAVRALRAKGGGGFVGGGGDGAVGAGAAAAAGAGAGAGAGAAAAPTGAPPSSSSPQPFFADVVIVSPDKDFFQLLSLDPRLSLLRLVKSGAEGNTGAGGGPDNGRFTDASDFLRLRPELERWGCGSWADVLALMGDSSDNVPGVRGVGEKTALALVGACGGVEAVLEAAAAQAKAEEEQGDEGGAPKKRRGAARKSEAASAAAAAAPTTSDNNNPLAAVKLNRKQREVLASPEGRAAARLALELVTVQTDLRVPPLRDLGPFDDDDGGEGGEGGDGGAAAATTNGGDLREALRLRVPADGGARLMAVFDALEMRKTAEQYSRLLQKWAGEGRV